MSAPRKEASSRVQDVPPMINCFEGSAPTLDIYLPPRCRSISEISQTFPTPIDSGDSSSTKVLGKVWAWGPRSMIGSGEHQGSLLVASCGDPTKGHKGHWHLSSRLLDQRLIWFSSPSKYQLIYPIVPFSFFFFLSCFWFSNFNTLF